MSRKVRFKILLLGETGVGKTSIKHRFLTGSFTENFSATIGADFSTSSFQIQETEVEIIIWDIAGNNSPASHILRKNFYVEAKGALLLFDVTNKPSFDKLENNWLKSVEEALLEKIPILVCGNKVDLSQSRVISSRDGENFCKKMQICGWEISYIETSAKEGKNVTNSFEMLTKSILLSNQKL